MRRQSRRLIVTALLAAAVMAGCGEPQPATRPAGTGGGGGSGGGGAGRAPTTRPADPPTTPPEPRTDAIDAEHLKKLQTAVNGGLTWLLNQRNDDGGWGFVPAKSHPALTAMAARALLRHPDYTTDSPAVAAALDVLMGFRQDDGGFYDPKEGNANYVTCVAVMALAAAKDPRYNDALAGAVRFLRGEQIVPGSKSPDGRAIDKDDPFAGGVSYGKHGRPDLSNLGFWMEAMHTAGVEGDDEAMQRALAFVKRVQNRQEGTEGQSFVVRGTNDGGFIYAIRHEGGKFVGESKAGETRRGLRSYGSMTYTGFKSMLYADVAKDDPRVRAAYEWIRKHWRLDSNPNMPQARSAQGLYYYYHVFAKALQAWGQDVIADARGVEHNWRHELIDVLTARRKPRGFWVNDEDPTERWREGNPVLATCYALLALQEALEK